jgi:hypothetical protein
MRADIVDCTALRLKDKNSIVRKKAIELLMSFIETSPFIAIEQDMGSLSERRFNEQVKSLNEVIHVHFLN